MSIERAIALVVERRDLPRSLAREVFDEIFEGRATPAQLGALLVGLRLKGETVEEIAGAAESMRRHALRLPARSRGILDTCGTGGDGAGTFNISTAAAFVAAGAGATVAKHGNRGVSSKCGSADVLAALGVNLEATPAVVAACVDEIGFGFCFAPLYHGAMKYAAPVRKELGVRTLFNYLGPLANPAMAERQLLGVADERRLRPMAEVLAMLGVERALVVCGADGLDEISLSGPTHAVEVRGGSLRELTLSPADAGLGERPREELRGGTAEENAAIVRSVLEGARGAPREAVLLNAGAALWVDGRAEGLREGVELAARAIDLGRAREKLEAVVARTRGGG